MTAIIALAVVGIALLLAELVLPGGIVGVGGIICLLAAVTLTFVNYGAMAGAIALVAVMVFGVIITALWIKNFHRLPFTRQLVLNQSIDDSSEELWLDSLVGKEGVTLTKISPSGHAEFDGEKVDVMTESGKIDKGKTVKVIKTRGPSIFVEEVSV
ncbi:MAG: NfeD family protein [Verrucomicrobiales bacterium]|nr:NfeD family protein [Verrucomicrobiales bacterium]